MLYINEFIIYIQIPLSFHFICLLMGLYVTNADRTFGIGLRIFITGRFSLAWPCLGRAGLWGAVDRPCCSFAGKGLIALGC